MHGSTQWSTSRGKASSIVPRWRKSPLQKVDPTKSHFLSVIFQQLELKAETFYFILFIWLIACLFVCLLCFSHYWSFNPDVKCRVFIQKSSSQTFFQTINIIHDFSGESGWRLRKFTSHRMFVNKAAFEPELKRLFLPTGLDRSSFKHCATMCTSTPGHYTCQGSLLHLIGSLALLPTGSAGGKQTQPACFVQSLFTWCIKITKLKTVQNTTQCLYTTFGLGFGLGSELKSVVLRITFGIMNKSTNWEFKSENNFYDYTHI